MTFEYILFLYLSSILIYVFSALLKPQSLDMYVVSVEWKKTSARNVVLLEREALSPTLTYFVHYNSYM